MPSPQTLITTTLTLLTTLALAVPNVTVVPTTGGCSDFPGYDTTTGITNTWDAILKNSDNSSIEGFGSEYEIVYEEGVSGVEKGRVTIVPDNDYAKLGFQCNSAAPGLIQAFAPIGVSGYQWQQINITDLPWDAELGWGWGQYSTPITTFRHVVNGTVQPGLFLGQDNYTTWAVSYQPVDAANGISLAYWNLRLLGNGSQDPITGAQLEPGESMTFLMVSGSDV